MALVLTLETYNDRENGTFIINSIIAMLLFYHVYQNHYNNYLDYFHYSGWLESVGSRIVYKLEYRNPVLYVIPIQSILGKLPVVTVPIVSWDKCLLYLWVTLE
jgi:hypothetical protein